MAGSAAVEPLVEGAMFARQAVDEDLTSPRFAGEPHLEAIFDRREFMTFGWFGCSVKKVQQALIEAGFDLPKFGVDGDYREETRNAVIQFQSQHAEKTGFADGIVGRKTLGALQDAVAPVEVNPVDCTVPRKQDGDGGKTCAFPECDPNTAGREEELKPCGTHPTTGEAIKCFPIQGTGEKSCGVCQIPHEERECPPGTVPDPSGEFCIIPLPGRVVRPCTDAEMAAKFESTQEFCAGIRTAIDLACQLGTGVCDIGGPVGKLACEMHEKIFGKPFPGTKPPECSEPRAAFFEKCVVSTIVGERESMPCHPGSEQEIREKFRQWPGRAR